MLHVADDFLIGIHAQIVDSREVFRKCLRPTKPVFVDVEMDFPVIDANGIQESVVIEVKDLSPWATMKQTFHLPPEDLV